jgi:hypothetical protein
VGFSDQLANTFTGDVRPRAGPVYTWPRGFGVVTDDKDERRVGTADPRNAEVRASNGFPPALTRALPLNGQSRREGVATALGVEEVRARLA